MPAVIQRDRIEYIKDVDTNDIKRLPEENKQLREKVQTQELQLAEKSKETHALQLELASERGLRQGGELGVKLALQTQAQLITSGIGAGHQQALPLERKYLEFVNPGRVESESLSSSSRPVIGVPRTSRKIVRGSLEVSFEASSASRYSPIISVPYTRRIHSSKEPTFEPFPQATAGHPFGKRYQWFSTEHLRQYSHANPSICISLFRRSKDKLATGESVNAAAQ